MRDMRKNLQQHKFTSIFGEIRKVSEIAAPDLNRGRDFTTAMKDEGSVISAYLNAPDNFSSFIIVSIAVMILTPGFALQYTITSCSNSLALVTWM